MCFQENVQELKDQGNACIKSEKYEEAVLHYTQALAIDSKNFSLYSNRSLAFLKMKQFYFALQDAMETIKLNPTWAKVRRSINV
jgi:Flp pilus assembly protein TadD